MVRRNFLRQEPAVSDATAQFTLVNRIKIGMAKQWAFRWPAISSGKWHKALFFYFRLHYNRVAY